MHRANPTPTTTRMMHERYYAPVALAMWAGGAAGRPRLKLLGLLAFVLCAGSGCGASTFRDGVFDNGVVRYHVGQPGQGWEQVTIEDSEVLAFRHAALRTTVSITATCDEYEDVPEAALLNHLLFGMQQRVFRLEETITLDGRGALHTVVDVELDGVPKTLEIYLLKKDGCVYDMTLIASRTDFERARDGLAKLVSGFHVIRTSLDD